MRLCYKCGKYKDDSDFAKNGEYYRHSCKSCESNKNLEKIFKTIAYVQSLKICCSICGYNKDKSALEFHHLDENTKSFNIGNFASKRIWSKNTKTLIDNEIKKCICVCANCHREIHSKQIPEDVIASIDFTFNNKTRQQLAMENKLKFNGKFNENDIITIRTKYNNGVSYKDLANFYGCHIKTIKRIVNFITYKYVN